MKEENIFLQAVAERVVYGSENDCQKKTLRIGYGIDNNYARCAGVSMASLCEENKAMTLEFYIITDGLDASSKQKFQQLARQYKVRIEWIRIEKAAFWGMPVREDFPLSMYYRLLLPLVLQTGKILYLDADVFCLGAIDTLLSIDFGGKVAAAVRDFPVVAAKREKALQLPAQTYFNSGVLFINIDAWGSADMGNRILNIIQSNRSRLQYPDQDALNIGLQGQLLYLDGAFNRINLTAAADGAQLLQQTKLIHFTAHPKPWSAVWQYRGHFLIKDIYSRYEARSPWAGEALELPVKYKHKKWYAQGLRKEGRYKEALHWYMEYIKTKYKF